MYYTIFSLPDDWLCSQSQSSNCGTPNSWILWILQNSHKRLNSWKILDCWTREDSNS